MNRIAKFSCGLLLAFPLASMRAAAVDEARVIVPGATQQAEKRGEGGANYGAISVVGVLVLAGAGAWLLMRGRKMNLGTRDARLLNVVETRSLGNRQYLVVATYGDKKFLLGVCPGRIDLLAPLSGPGSEKTP